jgi:hypothetical protein
VKSHIKYTFTLKKATAAFVEMLENLHLTWLKTKSQSYILNFSCENLQTRMYRHFERDSFWHAVYASEQKV